MGKMIANKDNAKFISKVYSQEDGYKASAMLTLVQPSDDDYIKLNGVQFTFKDDPADNSKEVAIGDDVSASIDNLLLEPDLPDTAIYKRIDADKLKIEYKTIGDDGNDYTIEVSWVGDQPTSLSGGSDTPDTDWKKAEMTAKFKYPEIPVGSDSTSSVLYSAGINDGDDILLYNSTDGIVKNEGITIGDTVSIVDVVDPFDDDSGVALWKLDGDAKDAGGNYDGTWHGTEDYDDGKFGQGAKFDGSDDLYIDTTVKNLSNPYTITYWAKIASDKQHLTSIYKSNSILISNKDSNNNPFVKINNVVFNNPPATHIIDNSLHHYVVVFDGTDGKIYRDNELLVSQDVSPGSDDSDSSLIIGGDGSSTYSLNDGDIIDQVRIFNRALTDEEIDALYKEELKQLDISGLSEAPTKAWKYVPLKLALSLAPTEQDLRIDDVELIKISSTTTEFVGKTLKDINIANGEDVLLEGNLVALNDNVVKEGLSIVDVVDPFDDDSGVALWKLDGDAKDAGGNYDGQWKDGDDNDIDGTYDDGKFGQGAKFDGDSKIDLGSGLDSVIDNKTFSISLWFYLTKFENDSGDPMMLISKHYNNDDGSFVIYCHFAYTTGDKEIRFKRDDVSLNEWHHLVFNYNNGLQQLYLDRVLKAEDNNGNISTTDDNWVISGLDESSKYKIEDGLIDQARIFNRALTDEEVDALYKEELKKYTLKFPEQSTAPQTAVIPKKSTEFTILDSNATYYSDNDVFTNNDKLTLDNVTGRRLQYMIEAPAKNTKIEQLNIDLYKG